MSSKYIVTVKCDYCGSEDTTETGSYCRPNWYKINIKIWRYKKDSSPNDRTEVRADYCRECIDKVSLETLILTSSKLDKKELKFSSEE